MLLHGRLIFFMYVKLQGFGDILFLFVLYFFTFLIYNSNRYVMRIEGAEL